MKLFEFYVLVTLVFLYNLSPVNAQAVRRGPCQQESCQNGGTCTEVFTFIFCACADGFNGQDCSIEDPCYSNPCDNGGTCIPSDDQPSFTCACPVTHTGRYCQFGAVNLEGICGTTPAASPLPRFFGGVEAGLGNWPWQGYIQFARGINFGVTLISDQWAITSAGNTEYLSTITAMDEVVFGDVFQGTGEEVSNYRQVAVVESVYTYPGLNYFTFEGDVQLLKFVEPLEITDFVRPICLPTSDRNEVEDYDVCWVAGWGQNEDGEINTLLQQAKTSVLDYQNCSQILEEADLSHSITENMICSFISEQGVGPCLGDGGNAVACAKDGVWEVAGIVSFGFSCGDPAVPFVSWRTASFFRYIESHISMKEEESQCEPVELEECQDLLPYNMTYNTSQSSFTNRINGGLYAASAAVDSGYCDAEELKFVLCALSLGECREDGPSMVLCKDYCEEVRYNCGLGDYARMCDNLPYGNYGDKWCVKGQDLSCGEAYILVNEGQSAYITSPGFPKGYDPIRRCFWHVAAPEGYVIQVKFAYLGIDTDADFLSIGEGNPYNLATTSLRVDGYNAPPIWTSETNSTWLRFQTTDDYADGAGFALYVGAVPAGGRECEESDIVCDDTCYPDDIACDFINDCMDGTDEEGCNVIEVPQDGVNFSSPFFPAPGYPSNFDYTWMVTVPPGYYIGVVFSALGLDEGADFLTISNCENEEPLYRFTGYIDSLRILPAYETLCIRLTTDEYNFGGHGFIADAYPVNASQADEEECLDDYELDCGDGTCLSFAVYCDGSQQCSNGADEERCPPTTCYDGTEIPYGEACNFLWYCDYGEDELSCPLRELGDEFYISTPRNPYVYDEYQSGTEFIWTITAEEGLSLAVSFPFFYTEPQYDPWILGIGNEPSEAHVTHIFSGFTAPAPLLVDSNEMFAYFMADGTKNVGGVTMKVTVVNKEELLYCDKGTFVDETQICNGFWDCLDGRDEQDCEPIERLKLVDIILPGWPFVYPNNAEFKWTFKAQEGQRIYLELPDFNTEEKFDVLRVGSGTACEEEYFREDSGVIVDDYIVLSEDETLCLYFKSDYSVGLRGFLGGLTAVDESDYFLCPEDDQRVILRATKACNGIWECPQSGQDEQDCPPAPFGTALLFQSPGFPNNYPPNTTINYNLGVAEGYVPRITFSVFDLEENVDFLTYGCGNDPFDESTIVTVLTGDEIPGPLMFNCSSIWARFESDDKGFDRGFEGAISVVDPNSPPGTCVVPDDVPPETICSLVYQCEELNKLDLECSLISEEPQPVSSPNYPESYNDSAKVISVFAVPEGYRILLTIKDFALEAFFDYLTIGSELETSSENYLARLTGNDLELPYTIISPGGRLFLVFESDDSVSDRGFNGTVQAVSEDDLLICNGNRVVPKEEICNYEWYCDDGSDEVSCDGAPIGAQGELYLPGYPDGEDYENNLDITWTFVGEPGSKFIVTVDKLDLEDGFDFLAIGYGFTPDESSTLAKLTGGMENIPDEPLQTPSEQLWVTFSSDDSFNLQGFFANIFVVSADIDVCRPPPDSRPAVVCELLSQCNEFEADLTCELLSEEVHISSPNYPETYNDSVTIASVFVAPRGYRILLNITDFATEAFYDFLTINSMVAPDAEQYLERLSGNELELPLTLVSPGQTLLLKFEADDDVGDTGYYGTVSLISEEEFLICDGTRIVPQEEICNYLWYCLDGADEANCMPAPVGAGGPLATPGYSVGEDYANDLNLTWSFTSVPGSNFMVTLTDLEVEYGFDFLVIGYGKMPGPRSTIARLTGTIDELNQTVFETPDNMLWVRFMSDGAFNMRGFYLNIVAVDNFGVTCSDGTTAIRSSLCNYRWDCPNGADEEDCDALQEGDYALIYTPNYPDDYPNNANISWVIQAAEGLILLANFTDFYTEGAFDIVTVGNGPVPCIEDTIIARFSGVNIPRDVFSNTNAMWVMFTSDGGIGFSGFFANISAVSADDFNACYDGTLIPPSEVCNFQWFCESGVDERGYDISCPTLGLGSRTNFSSPEFPYLFPDETNLTWTFTSDSELQFNVTVLSFDATNGSLTIGTGVDPTNESSVVLKLTGYVLEETNAVIPSNEMWARFYGPLSGLGFITDVLTLLPGQGANLCGYFPCYNGGNCTFEEVFYPEGVCECPRFFTGRYCETHFCAFDSCQNGATCDGVDVYCICPDGFIGEFCELDNTVCEENNPCPTGSECSPQYDGSALCECPDGLFYEPDQACPVELCGDGQCLNGGSCYYDEENPQGVCVCSSFYTGATCETHFCEAYECQNGGTCDGIDTYCICPDGFGGSLCQYVVENVTGDCSQVLPYTQARVVPSFNVELFFAKDIIGNFFVNENCSPGVPGAVCAILFPPADDSMGPCIGACNKFFTEPSCQNVGLLISVTEDSCEQLTHTEMVPGYPGVCTLDGQAGGWSG